MDFNGMILLISTIILSTLTEIYTQEWSAPYFSKSSRGDVEFGIFSGDTQNVAMDEEIAPIIDLIVIEYQGSEPPQLVVSFPRSNNKLGAVIERYNGKWKIVVTIKQDYEDPDMRRYILDITASGITRFIVLNIRNIWDNRPVLTSLDTEPCKIEEMKKDFTSNCMFQVEDPDGFGETDAILTFSIIGNFNEDRLFEFREKSGDNSIKKYNLHVLEELDYSLRTLFNFRAEVRDKNNNMGSLNIIVEVVDVPNKDPIWIRPFATARFEEKQPKTFNVLATDGDTFINKTIWYRLEFDDGKDYSSFIRIEKETGTINVEPIDRDKLQNDFFPFSIFAYKYDNETWGIYGPASLIVDDINDNFPEIELKPEILQIREAEYLTLNFETFFINDIDLGPHATYDAILLEPPEGEKYSSAFNIIPTSGYQQTNFAINVLNATLLDYEDPIWRSFEIIVRAVENDKPDEHIREKTVMIELINWNDELPEFEQTEYSASVLENVTANHLIATVVATDADVGDSVVYTLIGGINNFLEIRETGEIYTKSDNVFDYERQTELLVQIQAEDTLQTVPNERLHRVFAQLTIKVDDVNDETPEIRMPRNVPDLVENSEGGVVVTQEIVGTDPDLDADLIFEIDWDKSYAMHIKEGKQAEKDSYAECFIIETVPQSRNFVYGHLKVNPDFVTPDRQIDYEKYEIIYLTIRIIDRNQISGDDQSEGILTIRISDVNDNPPRFIEDTLGTLRTVVEEAASGTSIGAIFATDDDGPGNNEITYSMASKDVNSPIEWVEINSQTGAISVKANEKIGCDDPKIDFLTYEITLDDGVFTVSGMININVTDVNNQYPEIGEFPKEIKIYENADTGDEIVTVTGTDIDRDEPHNIIQYTISYGQNPELQKFFKIHDTKGDLYVDLQNGNKLDRDEGDAFHDIPVKLEDNYGGNGRRNSDDTTIRVILLDVNNKHPEMPPDTTVYSVREETRVGTVVVAEFYAPDKDDTSTPNAKVSYEILSITAGGNNLPDKDPSDIFKIESYGDFYGRITVGKELKGYHGDWRVEIRAYDHGDEHDTQISLDSKATYTFVVEPYNYNAPEIVFPPSNSRLRLKYADQLIGRPLHLTDDTLLSNFLAKDDDGGRFGNVAFSIMDAETGSGDASYFMFNKLNEKESQLILQKEVVAKTYRINIVATDDSGEGRSSPFSNILVSFIDMNGEPYFDERDDVFNTDFTENEEGLTEERLVPEALDPKNDEAASANDKIPVYYFIHTSFNQPDADYFELDKVTRKLTLRKTLDREAIPDHEFKIVATNNADGPRYPVSDRSTLLIHVKVNDVNDNPPKFDTTIYASGITSTDPVAKVILTVHATDPDEDDVIKYEIVPGSITTSGNSFDILDDKDRMFALNENTGALQLNLIVRNTMMGFFEFRVEAMDAAQHTDECNIKIYIVAESNRVTFVFFNTLDEVNNNTNRQFVVTTFTELFKYEANIDDVTKGQIDDEFSDDLTNVRVHFIENNEAIEATVIQSKISDLSFLTRLQLALQEHDLKLNDVANSRQDGDNSPTGAVQIMLIVSTVILGLLCIILTTLFTIRTRNLNRQLKAMSATDFGSISSNMNRREAPTTNFFAVEGSNPVLNHNNLIRSQFDDLSIQSEESSDFVGIDDDPTFMAKISNQSNGKHENPLANVQFDDEHIVSSKF